MKQEHKRKRLLFLLFTGAICLILLVIGSYQIYDFTESTAFCGQLCHDVMYPEYTTYQSSPHSRVRCADCHVGPGANYLIQSKIAGVPMIWGTITGNYPRPIESPVDNLRPARDTCQQCHWPEKFSGELVKQIKSFRTDETNTQIDTTLVLNIGSGKADVARGIHWHVAAELYYLPLDQKRLKIGEVWAIDQTGNSITYIDPDQTNPITPELISSNKRLMDCIDCHNRATHIFSSPEELINSALSEGRIDTTLPFVKRESLRLLDPVNPNLDEANTRIESIRSFYQTNYPFIYETKKAEINSLINELKQIARLTTFPDMNVNWNTHPDHSAHQSSPGCFRCHGKLVAANGPNAGKIIDARCDLCHKTLTQNSAATPATP
jgi:nitrate/TMAO reductase-like tetraheme cytochrome c subunit